MQTQSSLLVKKAVQLFRQEAQRLDELGKHSQIPSLLAHFEQNKQLYLVQELIEGETLEQELQQVGAFNETQIWELLRDLVSVLKFIHDRKVIHRDIKPANIIRRRWDSKLDLLHKCEKGEAFADKNPDFTDKSGHKCFAPTAKNRLLQEVYSFRSISEWLNCLPARLCFIRAQRWALPNIWLQSKARAKPFQLATSIV
jgi:serine/threonine protein kinase